MSIFCDIKIIYDIYGDLSIINGEIEIDDTIQSAIIVSLFTDARIQDSIESDVDRRGFWGDAQIDDDRETTGSLLWRLERSTITDTAIEDRKRYCSDALRWLISDGIADTIDVFVDRSSTNVNGLKTTIKIHKNKKNLLNVNF